MAIYFPHVNATFIHIPKNAGNSLKKWVRDHSIVYDDQLNHATVDQAKDIWPSLGYIFSFVRNPYSRTVSIFHYLGQHAKRRILTKQSNNVADDLKTVNLYTKGFDYWLNCLYDTNSEFNENFEIATINGHSTWPRRANQTLWLSHVDLAFKIEELDTKFHLIEDLLECKTIHCMERINPSEHLDYREYYNDQNKQIIQNMFKDDLDTFNYDY